MNISRLMQIGPETSLRSGTSSMACASVSAPRRRRSKVSNCNVGQNGSWSQDSDCSSDDNNSPTALNSFRWSKPALEDKSLDFGWAPNSQTTTTIPDQDGLEKRHRPMSNGYVSVTPEVEEERSKCNPMKTDELFQGKCDRISCSKHDDCLLETKSSYMKQDFHDSNLGVFSTSDSLNDYLSTPPEEGNESLAMRLKREEEELRKAAWFQAGIPREIALEVLSGKPEGSFIVRESTTKPGCYALSLKVPPGKNPTGIAHYLILHTNRGFKIKGFTKEFKTLDALITHHSVMPELLPCTLSLPRFNKDRGRSRRDDDMDFLPTEKRCSIFSDIHWVMTDMKL